jgi:hypothetical protein
MLCIVVLQAIQQIPQEYAIKSIWPIIKVLPGVRGFWFTPKMTIHPQEKIEHEELVNAPGEEVDVFAANRPHVQCLGFRPIRQLLDNECQGMARIVQQVLAGTISILGARWFHF